jgi:hypothetical protein
MKKKPLPAAMNQSERAFAQWLTMQGCPWVFISQAPGEVADGALRSRPRRPIHRPDFLLFMDGIGTIAIDVKNYELKLRSVQLSHDVTLSQDKRQHDVMYVRFVWDEIVALTEFERVSTIPTWICLYIADEEGAASCLYRASTIYDAFAPVFIARDRMLVEKGQDDPELFDGWPITRSVDPSLPSKAEVFDFVIDDVEDLYSAVDARSFPSVNVPPIIVQLDGESSIVELISFDRPEVASRPASDAAVRFAKDIASLLNLTLPDDLDQRRCSNFIERHKAAFYELKAK